MFKNNKYSAMTLAEVCLIFVIIGVIASLAITIIKPFERTVKFLYTRIYQALKVATYNGMLNRDEEGFPTTAAKFCSILVEYINSPTEKCSTNIYSKDEPLIFDENHATIIASNGARIYIVGNTDTNKGLITYTDPEDESITAKYYLVYADINGSRGKATTKWTEKDAADVVGFAVTDKQEVIPLGYPAIDPRYLTVNVMYPSTGDEENLSDPISFYEAKHLAYGDAVIPNNEMTYNWQNNFDSSSLLYIPDTAYPNVTADTAKSCKNDVTSPCSVKFEEYE